MVAPDVFRLPDLGEGLTDAEIVSWHVGPGDRVTAGQPLLAVETDKAVVEIPAPQAGVIAALHGAVGERIAVGAPLVTFGTADAATDALVGRIADAPSIAAAPAVRRLARELGVELGRVRGSGPGGTIVSRDVRAALAAGAPDASTPGAAAASAVHGTRRAMAERMAAAHARVVPATVTGEADIDGWAPGTPLLSRLIRAIGAAASAEPQLNAAFDDAQWQIRANQTVDLGVAVDTSEGLFVPVLRDVAARPIAELAAEFAELHAAVEARTIAPERLRGQTITLSNFGAVAGIHATMVVVPPQVAIVGAGRAAPRVVPGAGGAVVHRVLPLSITIDHRVITGVEACRFLAALIADLERRE